MPATAARMARESRRDRCRRQRMNPLARNQRLRKIENDSFFRKSVVCGFRQFGTENSVFGLSAPSYADQNQAMRPRARARGAGVRNDSPPNYRAPNGKPLISARAATGATQAPFALREHVLRGCGAPLEAASAQGGKPCTTPGDECESVTHKYPKAPTCAHSDAARGWRDAVGVRPPRKATRCHSNGFGPSRD